MQQKHKCPPTLTLVPRKIINRVTNKSRLYYKEFKSLLKRIQKLIIHEMEEEDLHHVNFQIRLKLKNTYLETKVTTIYLDDMRFYYWLKSRGVKTGKKTYFDIKIAAVFQHNSYKVRCDRSISSGIQIKW